MNKNWRDLIDLSWERPENMLYIFNTVMYVPSFANICIFWNLIFGKHILSCWLYQYLWSRWYGSHEMLRKFIELFFVHTYVQAGLPQCFVFYNFIRGRGGGEVFITWDLFVQTTLLSKLCKHVLLWNKTFFQFLEKSF